MEPRANPCQLFSVQSLAAREVRTYKRAFPREMCFRYSSIDLTLFWSLYPLCVFLGLVSLIFLQFKRFTFPRGLAWHHEDLHFSHHLDFGSAWRAGRLLRPHSTDSRPTSSSVIPTINRRLRTRNLWFYTHSRYRVTRYFGSTAHPPPPNSHQGVLWAS